MNPITEQLITFAAQKFKVDKSAMEESDDLFESLKIDSVQALSLLSDVEMMFNVEIPDYELQDVRTFQDLASVILRRKA